MTFTRDNDSTFGSFFTRVATTSAIEILKTPYHAPRANAICERYVRSGRQECLDHLLIFGEKQLKRVLNEYVVYFNRAQPYKGSNNGYRTAHTHVLRVLPQIR